MRTILCCEKSLFWDVKSSHIYYKVHELHLVLVIVSVTLGGRHVMQLRVFTLLAPVPYAVLHFLNRDVDGFLKLNFGQYLAIHTNYS